VGAALLVKQLLSTPVIGVSKAVQAGEGKTETAASMSAVVVGATGATGRMLVDALLSNPKFAKVRALQLAMSRLFPRQCLLHLVRPHEPLGSSDGSERPLQALLKSSLAMLETARGENVTGDDDWAATDGS
jgi:hypothetical protein